MSNDRSIIVAGNPVDGFKFYGPFDDTGSANEWADDNIRNEDWVVGGLIAPAAATDGGDEFD